MQTEIGERYFCGGEGKARWRLTLPLFLPEERFAEPNGFYLSLVGDLITAAREKHAVVLSAITPTLAEKDRVSFYVDISAYRDGKLCSYRRFADTRGEDGLCLLPPSRIRGKIPKNGGWYLVPGGAVVFCNSYLPGEEAGLRRSQYGSLIKTEGLPAEKKRLCGRGARDGGGR